MSLSTKNYYAGLLYQAALIIVLTKLYSIEVALAVTFATNMAYFFIMSLITEGK